MKLFKIRVILVGALLLSPIVSFVTYTPAQVEELRKEIKRTKKTPLRTDKTQILNEEFKTSRSRKAKVKILKQYTKYIAMRDYNYTEKQYHKLVAIWTQESQWNWKAQNPHSRAYGIPQIQWTEPILNPFVQILKGLAYVQDRYGNADQAYAFKLRNGWY
jgi:SLT domain-containing protein